MRDYPKQIKKELKKLSDLAYRRELDKELEKMAKQFDDWRQRRMNCFELNEKIHEFHNGVSRELWSKYESRHEDFMVTVAIVKNIIKKEEISLKAFEHIKDLIESYNKL